MIVYILSEFFIDWDHGIIAIICSNSYKIGISVKKMIAKNFFTAHTCK